MKWTLFEKKKAAKTDTGEKEQSAPETAPAKPKQTNSTLPGAKEEFYVDRSCSYGEPVDFINEKKGIRKPIIRNHEFVGFPGVDETVEEGRQYCRRSKRSYADWMNFVERKPIRPRFEYLVQFSRPDEHGRTRVLWMLQPHDTADESGFGMEDIPEITLVAYLDENGEYTGPFRLEKVAW